MSRLSPASPISAALFSAKSYWRTQAAAIVAELFPVTPRETWDALLDFRTELLHGKQLAKLLDQFLKCRNLLESDHYIPFFRLRRLIDASLRLSATFAGQNQPEQLLPLRLWKTYRSFEDVLRHVRRNRFEHDLDFSEGDALHLEVKEFSEAGV